MMSNFQIVILLMAASVLLVSFAQKLRMAYPIALVLGGALLGFIPGINGFTFDPNLVLVIVLPPVLYYGAFWISNREFSYNWKEIFSLGIGLVFVTTLIVGVLFKWLFPGLPWALAFAFGALISPPDATAATSILQRFAISSRLRTLLESESLINDASALVLYRIAVAALLSGTFSLHEASVDFIEVVLGGVAIGFVMGFLFQSFSSRFLQPVIGVMFSLTIPYITYIIADSLGASGVLAVVVNGLILSNFFVKYNISIRRVLGIATWDMFIVLLNCFVFILIGLQLKKITEQMTFEQMSLYVAYAALFTFVIILVRMFWIYARYGIMYYRASLCADASHRCPQILREGAILGWAGMRGIVSLAAVLGLPLTMPDGQFNGRDIVTFITFVVILLTLLIPGLTLAPLIRWLKIHHAPESHAVPELRKELLEVIEKEVNLFSELNEEERVFLKDYFKARHKMLEISASKEEQFKKLENARNKLLLAQREHLLKLWEKKVIDENLLKFLELEIDLEQSTLIRAVIQ